MKQDPVMRGLVFRRGVYWFNRTTKGKREWFNLETTDKFAAVQAKAAILRNPTRLAAAHSLTTGIERFLDWKVDHGEYTHITRDCAAIILKRFAAFAGKTATVATVRQSLVQAWYAVERGRVMDSTAHTYMAFLQSFFQWAVDIERARNDNPVKAVPLVKPTQRARIRFATKEQRDGLIAAAPDDDMRFVLYCGFHAGLRLNEISEARVFWFDLKQKLLHVQATPLPRGTKWRGRDIVPDIYGVKVRPFRTKGKKDRTIPMTASFHAFAVKYLAGRKPEEFAGQPDREFSISRYRWNFKIPFKEFMAKQGYPWLSPHIMRHAFASLLVQKGVSLYKVANWLGDSLAVSERHYAHLAPIDDAIQNLE
jgi:integrase